jgi:hypothetical protein
MESVIRGNAGCGMDGEGIAMLDRWYEEENATGDFPKLIHRLMRRVCYEHYSYPAHVWLAYLWFKRFGNWRRRVEFEAVPHPAYAVGLLYAADLARMRGLKRVVVIEFGVAQGSGLLAMCDCAAETTKLTGVEFSIFGFDAGIGLPVASDYRDHPEVWQAGAFPMVDPSIVTKRLQGRAELIIGDIRDTVPEFVARLSPEAPLGYVSIDVDLYHSTIGCLAVLEHVDPRCYLPYFMAHIDDTMGHSKNAWCGELLAIDEFNQQHTLRKIDVARGFQQRRVFRHAWWLEKLRKVHILDHPERQPR